MKQFDRDSIESACGGETCMRTWMLDNQASFLWKIFLKIETSYQSNRITYQEKNVKKEGGRLVVMQSQYKSIKKGENDGAV